MLGMYNINKKRGNTDMNGRYFWRIEDQQGDNDIKKCITWISLQEDVNFRSWYDQWFRSDRRMACPCSIWQALLDRGRYVWDTNYFWPNMCFRSRRFKYFVYFSNDLGFVVIRMRQLCCYSWNDFGAPTVGPPDGSRIIADPSFQFYVWTNGAREVYTDRQAHRFCCFDPEFCDLFYFYRPSDDCSLYRPPRRRKFICCVNTNFFCKLRLNRDSRD